MTPNFYHFLDHLTWQQHLDLIFLFLNRKMKLAFRDNISLPSACCHSLFPLLTHHRSTASPLSPKLATDTEHWKERPVPFPAPHTQFCSTLPNPLPLHKSPPAPYPLPASLFSPQNPCARETLTQETAAFFFVCESPNPSPHSQIPNFIT